MSCCGQTRDEASRTATHSASRTPEPLTRPAAPRGTVAASPAAAPIPADGVTVRLTHQTSIEVQGTVSGKRYRFSGRGAMQSIDRRDADSLLSTGFFERAWG